MKRLLLTLSFCCTLPVLAQVPGFGPVELARLTPATTDSEIIPDVLWLKFSEGMALTAADSSVAGNNGLLTNDLFATPGVEWVPGWQDGAVYFQRSNYISVGNDASLQLSGAMTITAWVNGRSRAAGTAGGVVAKLGASGSRGYMLSVDDAGALAGWIAPTSTTLQTVSTNAVITSTNWQHVAFVYTPSTSLELYVDGVLTAQNTTSIAASQFSTANNVNIGRRPDNGSALHGGIDDVRIYSTNLTSGQIAQIASAAYNPSSVSVYAGGIRNRGTSAAVSGGTAGRTFISVNSTNLMRKPGPITCFIVKVNQLDSVTNTVKLKIFRPNGSNYDFVAESELFTLTHTGDNVCFLNTWITNSREGDVPGCFLAGAGSATDLEVNVTGVAGTQKARWLDYDVSGSNVAFTNTIDYVMSMTVEAVQPNMLWTGDSIMAGHNAGASWLPWADGGISGTIGSSIPFGVSTNQTAYSNYVNTAKGGETFYWVNTVAMNSLVLDCAPNSKLWVHAGVNDVAGGWVWADVLTNLNAIRAKWPLTNGLYISEILPWTNGDDTEAATVRQWNTNLIAWAATNTVTIGTNWAAFGQLRVSTGFNDDLLTAYDQDGVHITQQGVSNYVSRVELNLP